MSSQELDQLTETGAYRVWRGGMGASTVRNWLNRAQPANPSEREEWTQDVLAAARLKHPHLAETLEVGTHDGWPFLIAARNGGCHGVLLSQAARAATRSLW